MLPDFEIRGRAVQHTRHSQYSPSQFLLIAILRTGNTLFFCNTDERPPIVYTFLACRHVVRAPFTCATRGCNEMWIENRVIHIVGITVWITYVIIHILGIILWIAWGQSAGHTKSTCINLVKVLCATIPAERTTTPPTLRPVICKCPSPSCSLYDGDNFRNY